MPINLMELPELHRSKTKNKKKKRKKRKELTLFFLILKHLLILTTGLKERDKIILSGASYPVLSSISSHCVEEEEGGTARGHRRREHCVQQRGISHKL